MPATDNITALARRLRVDVNMGTVAVPDWQQLIGVTKIKPTRKQRTEDDEAFDDDGAARAAITGYSWGLEVTIARRTGPDGVTFNTVHEKLRVAGDAASTSAGEVQIRWYDRNGRAEAYTGYALVDWTPDGGGKEALDTVVVTLNGQGARTSITNPLANTTPIVVAVAPAGGGIAGGTLVTVTGGYFTGATAVKFGLTAATSFTIVDSTRIVAVAPAHAAGQVDVTVTTPSGTSATSAADQFTYA